MKVEGIEGVQGPAGSGTTINVKEDGVIVPGGPFDVLNFQGTILTSDTTASVPVPAVVVIATMGNAPFSTVWPLPEPLPI